MKKVAVLGASPNPERYSFKAVQSLVRHGYHVLPVGNRSGAIGNLQIESGLGVDDEIDTISLYLNPTRQEEWKPVILAAKPRRVIFNPGTENRDFEAVLNQHGISTEEACTLVLLSTNQF